MSAWRIDDTDPTRPVHLDLGGPYPLRLTVGEAMSLLRTAPKMAGKWTGKHSPNVTRDNMAGTTVSVVFGIKNAGGAYEWAAWPSRDHAGTRQEAQDAADAALRAAGWLLEEG